MIDEDAISEAVTAETAYQSADGYFFRGELLEPFSSGRRAVADLMGFRFNRLNSEDWKAFIDSMSYPGIERDAALIVWVCLQSQRQLIQASKNTSRAEEEFFTWMEENINDDTRPEAIRQLTDILMDRLVSITGTGEEDKKTEADSEGDEGKPTPTTPTTNAPLQGSLGPPRILSDGMSRSQKDINGSAPTTQAREQR